MLFVLQRGRDSASLPTNNQDVMYGAELFGNKARVFKGERPDSIPHVDNMRRVANMLGQSKQLDCANLPDESMVCPFMVRFGNINDPQSVVSVDPTDVGSAFGSGTKLRPINITITNDRVREGGILKLLPWLKTFEDRNFDGSIGRDFTSDDVRRNLGCRSFMQGCTE
jgi:hypothetical protein